MDSLSLWLRLWHTPGVGAVRAGKLLDAFGSIENIFAAPIASLQAAGLHQKSALALGGDQQLNAVENSLAWASEAQNHILTLDSPSYPELLLQSPAPPAVLFVKGNPTVLGEPQLAMVGSRNPSQGGKETAYQFAKHLSQSGLLVTSGLALGVDGESHRGALEADAANAPSIAVVATGLDRVYPARHKGLAEELLAKGGAIVSEFPLGTSPKPEHFPQRNRIIAGLSLGTLVVEAALRSGSLITARQAQEAGREVFAIPGSIHNPLSKGCHALIKQGAKLVESAEDILEEIAPQLIEAVAAHPHKDTGGNEDSGHEAVLQAMGFEPVTIDELSQRTDFGSAELASMLLIMELEGLVNNEAGGRYQRRQ